MQIDQRKIKIFHVRAGSNETELHQFITKNKEIFKYYLLVFDELSDELRAYLDNIEIDYLHLKHFCMKPITQGASSKPNLPTQKQDSLRQEKMLSRSLIESAEESHTESSRTESCAKPSADSAESRVRHSVQSAESNAESVSSSHMECVTKVLHKVIRSGQNVRNIGDIVIFNRVNSAAIIKSDSNVCIFGECNGDVECNGEYMILSRVSNGKITFRSENITPSMLKYPLNLICSENGTLAVKDILGL